MFFHRSFVLMQILLRCHSFQIRVPSQCENRLFSSKQENDEVPSMDWLTDSLSTQQDDPQSRSRDDGSDMTASSPFIEEHSVEGDLGDVPIPTTGVSVSDEMGNAQRERFYTEVVKIKGLEEGVQANQIVTSSTSGSFEPVRYLIGLSNKLELDKARSENPDAAITNQFVMIDVPPYSDKLKAEIQEKMGSDGKLAAILITSRDCIHYNDAPGVFTIRKADLMKWEQAFPETARVAYRLDVPRDCQDSITQRLDGYGPFALEDAQSSNFTFIETGRPLVYEEWDHDTSQEILAGKLIPPDDEAEEEPEEKPTDEDEYTPEAIRAREEGKAILAVYTPGRSFGSVSYVFPNVGLCTSGFTLPIEDSRNDENVGVEGAGPALDCRGYITTSRAGIERQMESSRELIENYADRFNVIMPSRGDPYYADGDENKRKQELLQIINQYDKIGQIYEQLGITD